MDKHIQNLARTGTPQHHGLIYVDKDTHRIFMDYYNIKDTSFDEATNILSVITYSGNHTVSREMLSTSVLYAELKGQLKAHRSTEANKKWFIQKEKDLSNG